MPESRTIQRVFMLYTVPFIVYLRLLVPGLGERTSDCNQGLSKHVIKCPRRLLDVWTKVGTGTLKGDYL